MDANEEAGGRDMNLKYSDEDVCRLFLSGLCPHALFQSTKMDMGPCVKKHSLGLRKEYEKEKDNGGFKYTEEEVNVIHKLMAACYLYACMDDGLLTTIDGGFANKIPVSEMTQTPEVMELAKEIQNKFKEAEEFELEDITDLKIQAMEKVEELRSKRADKEAMLLFDCISKMKASTRQLKLKKTDDLGRINWELPLACDICGQVLNFDCSVGKDALADHFREKLHLAYVQIRERLSELHEESLCQEEKNKKRKVQEGGSSYAMPSGTVTITDIPYRPFRASDWFYKVDAAFSSSRYAEAYIFMGTEYAVINYVTHEVITKKALEEPQFICCRFQCLKFSAISGCGVDCAFRCKWTSEVFLFAHGLCVKIDFAPNCLGGDYIIEGPAYVQKLFPCLEETDFEEPDAAFESLVDGLAYLFRGDQYALITYWLADQELIATGPITEEFPCLRNTIFENGIGAAFTCHVSNQVYLFKERCYAILSFTPGYTQQGSTGFDGFHRIIGPVKEIFPNWPSLRQLLPRRVRYCCICEQEFEHN